MEAKKRIDVYVGSVVGGAYVDKETALREYNKAVINFDKCNDLIIRAQLLLPILEETLTTVTATKQSVDDNDLFNRINQTITSFNEQIEAARSSKDYNLVYTLKQQKDKLVELRNRLRNNDLDNNGYNGGLNEAAQQNLDLITEKKARCEEILIQLEEMGVRLADTRNLKKEEYEAALDKLNSYVEREYYSETDADARELGNIEHELSVIEQSNTNINIIDTAIQNTLDSANEEFDNMCNEFNNVNLTKNSLGDGTVVWIKPDGTVHHIVHEGVTYYPESDLGDAPYTAHDEVVIKEGYEYEGVTYYAWKKQVANNDVMYFYLDSMNHNDEVTNVVVEAQESIDQTDQETTNTWNINYDNLSQYGMQVTEWPTNKLYRNWHPNNGYDGVILVAPSDLTPENWYDGKLKMSENADSFIGMETHGNPQTINGVQYQIWSTPQYVQPGVPEGEVGQFVLLGSSSE